VGWRATFYYLFFFIFSVELALRPRGGSDISPRDEGLAFPDLSHGSFLSGHMPLPISFLCFFLFFMKRKAPAVFAPESKFFSFPRACPVFPH